MGRQLHKLNPRSVATLNTVGRHSDGGGLYLSISANGGRRWVFLFDWLGKRTELGLGSARDIGLAVARQAASACRVRLAAGQNPKTVATPDAEVAQPLATTFGDYATEYITTMRPSWKNEKHAAQWQMTLTKYTKVLQDVLLADITTDHILAVLKPRWSKTPETAKRLRGRIEQVLDAAKARGLRAGENPARWRGHLEFLLPTQSTLSRGHHKAMPYSNVPDFLLALRTMQTIPAWALEFVILTAARTSEVLLAAWPEFDLDTALWKIPDSRMKAQREHRVPLTQRPLEILHRLKALGGEGLVFPGRKAGRPLTNMTMLMLLRRKNLDVTVHGFRSSFKDWAAECTEFSNETSEAALAHVVGDKVEAAYRRGDQLDKRRKLMQAWDVYCSVQYTGKP